MELAVCNRSHDKRFFVVALGLLFDDLPYGGGKFGILNRASSSSCLRAASLPPWPSESDRSNLHAARVRVILSTSHRGF